MQKKKKLFNGIFVALIGALLIVSCSAEDGATGPIGPQGEQGEAGPQGEAGADGADGAQGEQGEPGTANVIYSGWIDSEFDNDIISTSASFTINAPLMTDDIIDEGVILVFGRTFPAPVTEDTDVYALPMVFGAARQQSYYYRAEEAEELVITIASNVEGDSAGVPFFGEYRYILIPGEQPTGGTTIVIGTTGSKQETLDYSKMSYEEVIEFFNIEE